MPVYASVCIKHVEKQQLFSLWEREGLSSRDYAWVFVTGKKISR